MPHEKTFPTEYDLFFGGSRSHQATHYGNHRMQSIVNANLPTYQKGSKLVRSQIIDDVLTKIISSYPVGDFLKWHATSKKYIVIKDNHKVVSLGVSGTKIGIISLRGMVQRITYLVNQGGSWVGFPHKYNFGSKLLPPVRWLGGEFQ
jgi:hypothetical protein